MCSFGFPHTLYWAVKYKPPAHNPHVGAVQYIKKERGCDVFIFFFSLQIYRGYTLIADSGAIYEPTISGGRVGVFQFGAFPVIWSYLKVHCLEHLNQGLYLDGVDDYVELDNIPTLKMEER